MKKLIRDLNRGTPYLFLKNRKTRDSQRLISGDIAQKMMIVTNKTATENKGSSINSSDCLGLSEVKPGKSHLLISGDITKKLVNVTENDRWAKAHPTCFIISVNSVCSVTGFVLC